MKKKINKLIKTKEKDLMKQLGINESKVFKIGQLSSKTIVVYWHNGIKQLFELKKSIELIK